jgi:predicted ATPase
LKDISLETKPLNLLMGLNGMGKSSFIQTLLLLKQSGNLMDGGLILNGEYTSIGKGKDALYQFAMNEEINFEFVTDVAGSLKWKFGYQPDADNLLAKEVANGKEVSMFKKYIDNLLYLSADRNGPSDLYETQKSAISQYNLGMHGEFTVHFLHEYGQKIKVPERLTARNEPDLSLISQVNGWLNSISPGISVKVIELPHVDKLLLSYEFTLGHGKTTGFKPKNVGFGISFVLPVITALLNPVKDRIVIIENPESHIHPKGQAELGRLIALSAAAGAQLFVETHSDHIVNGIRVAVKDKLIPKQDTSIFYFDKTTTPVEQYSNVALVKIDDNGELSDYPKDFMDEWNNQLLQLI